MWNVVIRATVNLRCRVPILNMLDIWIDVYLDKCSSIFLWSKREEKRVFLLLENIQNEVLEGDLLIDHGSIWWFYLSVRNPDARWKESITPSEKIKWMEFYVNWRFGHLNWLRRADFLAPKSLTTMLKVSATTNICVQSFCSLQAEPSVFTSHWSHILENYSRVRFTLYSQTLLWR